MSNADMCFAYCWLLALIFVLMFVFLPCDAYSAKRGLEIAWRLFVCPSVTLVDHNHIG